MGKYASKDTDSGLVVTWGSVTGKPLSFPPSTHNNAAHSEVYITTAALSGYATIASLAAYAPLANPEFTGNVHIDSVKDTTALRIQCNTTTEDAYYHYGSLKFSEYADDFGPLSEIRHYSNLYNAWISYLAFYVTNGAGPTLQEKFRIKHNGISAYANLDINGGLHVGGESDPGDNNILADGSITGASLKTANWSLEEDGNDLIIKRGSTILARLSSTGLLKTKADQQVDSTI